jgi:hypothetical protein
MAKRAEAIAVRGRCAVGGPCSKRPPCMKPIARTTESPVGKRGAKREPSVAFLAPRNAEVLPFAHLAREDLYLPGTVAGSGELPLPTLRKVGDQRSFRGGAMYVLYKVVPFVVLWCKQLWENYWPLRIPSSRDLSAILRCQVDFVLQNLL